MVSVSNQKAYDQFTNLLNKHYRPYCSEGFVQHKILEKGNEGKTFKLRCDYKINYAVQLDFDESQKLRTIFIRVVTANIKTSGSVETLSKNFCSWLFGFSSNLFYLQPDECCIGVIKITEDEKVVYGSPSIPHGTYDDYSWHSDYELSDFPIYVMNVPEKSGVTQEKADENGFGDLIKLPMQPTYHTAIRVMLLAGLLYGFGKLLSWGFHKMKTSQVDQTS